jgi:hypothetical protein
VKSSHLFLFLLFLAGCVGIARSLDQVGENSVGLGLAGGVGAGAGLLIPGLGPVYGAVVAVGGFLCALFSRAPAAVNGAAQSPQGSPWTPFILLAITVLAVRAWAHWPSILRPAWQTFRVSLRAFLGGRPPK